jgi:amino-acid N-acetyltransferase
MVDKAKIGDVPQMHKLINSFADRGEMLHRPLSELYENLRDFFVIREGGEVIACCALHICWADLAEIKALAVKEENQEQGLGKLLVEACIEEAKTLGLSTIFCLTYKPDFFEKFGFRRVNMMKLPRKVWGECQRCPKFPNCDEIAMVLSLKSKGRGK